MLNLVCICCDTFRADIIGPGKKLSFVETPNLDQLARESVVFDRAYGEAQATIQMRLAFFTGNRTFPYDRNPGARGLMCQSLGWHRIPDEQTALAEKLFEAGYVTGFVTDVFHMFKPTMNFHRGFMHWDFIRGQEADPVHCGPLDAVDVTPHIPDDDSPNGLHDVLRQYLIGIQDRRTELDYFTPQVFNGAIRFLEDNHRRPPFFLWVDSFAPHELWDPPMYYADRYCVSENGKSFILPQVGNRRSAATITDGDIERTKALYYGYVTFVDKWIGALLSTLDEMRLLDDTIVLFTSDHGTELMDNGVFSKNLHGPRSYNHQIPLMIRMPGKQHAGAHVEPFVLSHDIHATILDLLGVEHPEPIQGQSVWPLVTGEAEDLHGDTIISGWTQRACVRDREWALIIDTIAEGARPELFHTGSDPYETENVAEEHPEIVTDRVRKLEDFLGGPLPYSYGHQVDLRNQMTLRRHLQIRRELGLPE
jgi:arylsulfatase A-like enzyme